MTPAWIHKEQWVSLEAPLVNLPGDRHPQKLITVVEQFELATAERYEPVEKIQGNGQKSLVTWCNVGVCDVTKALGCPIPRVVERNGVKHEQRANEIYLWLIGTEGRQAGWWQVSRELAGKLVALGCPVVAAWFNDTGGPGHLAILQPAMHPAPNIEGALQLAAGQLYTAQAGAERWNHDRLERGFGPYRPIFIAHA